MLTRFCSVICLLLILNNFDSINGAMTLKQIEQSMATFRKSCMEQTGVDPILIDGVRRGEFPENNKQLKCFTLCIAEYTGTLTKRKEVSESKMRRQIETHLPVDLRELAITAYEACKHVQKAYKDPCDRMFYSTKCIYNFIPEHLVFL